MKLIFILPMFVTLSFICCDVDVDWELFKSTFKKTYKSPEDESYRFKHWLQRSVDIRAINQQNNTFQLQMNPLGDMTDDEIKETRLGFRIRFQRILKRAPKLSTKTTTTSTTTTTTTTTTTSTTTTTTTITSPISISTKSISQSLNYTAFGYVTPVKDQGNCGSCWSFAATGALEGQYFKKYGILYSLSEQNLVDCSSAFGNAGCDGGDFSAAYQYVNSNQGINNETTYPYTATNGTCKVNESALYANVLSHTYVPDNNETALLLTLINTGPIAVAIDASHSSFWYYGSGVYYEANCSSTLLNHAVLVVGYGTENGSDYWLVKNSWGISWGMSGYIKMARNRDNNCGIAMYPVYPIVV